MPDWAERFLKVLGKTPNVSAAATAAGVSRQTVYLWREKCPELREAWDAAIDASLDRLEEKAFERAESTSDTLMIFLLKSHRPDRYRETQNFNHSGGFAVSHSYVEPGLPPTPLGADPDCPGSEAV